jgi:hypothetical protein
MSSIVWTNTHNKGPESKHRSKSNTKTNTSLLNLSLAKTLRCLPWLRLIVINSVGANIVLHAFGSKIRGAIPFLATALVKVQ